MLLHRVVVVLFDAAIPSVHRWGYVSEDGVTVSIELLRNSEDQTDVVAGEGLSLLVAHRAPITDATQILLRATVAVECAEPYPRQLRVPDGPRANAERALSEMSAMIGIQAEVPWKTVSPHPYMALSADCPKEVEQLRNAKRILLPAAQMDPPMLGHGLAKPMNVASLLKDRRDGVMLLGAAVRVGEGIAKLHELFRVFENGFGRAGDSLVGPLTTFLQSYPDWDLDYDRDEVQMWVRKLRHPATHADLSKSKHVAYDSDVERHLRRVEQAAYDVLFNKSRWNVSETDRTMRWALASAVGKDESPTIVSPGSVIRASARLDHFGAFPLAEGINIEMLPDGGGEVLLGTWYFTEEDHREFEAGNPEHGGGSGHSTR